MEEHQQTSVLKAILNAKEQRSAFRHHWAQQSLTSISLSFNIAGYPKTDERITKAFEQTVSDLKDFLYAHRVILKSESEHQKADAVGDFYLAAVSFMPFSAIELKALCEQFEQEHFLQRLIDVDIMNEEGQMVSSHRRKKCFLCEHSAVECLKQQSHSLDDIRTFIFNKITAFLHQTSIDETANTLTSAATQALLYEVSLSPKPGLVDRFGSGSHTDMDFFTFVNSTSTLAPYWRKIVHLAYRRLNDIDQETQELRIIGIAMERAMMQATQQVNTQRGAIYILGYLVYVVAQLKSENRTLSSDNIRAGIQRLHKDSLKDPLTQSSSPTSPGQKVIAHYGKNLGGGIRKEMSEGIPCLFEEALPYLEENITAEELFHNSKKAQNVLQKCLLKIISVNQDTNILHRSKPDTLRELQELSKKTFKENVNFNEKLAKICDFCQVNHISPGGSADLLAASIFIFRIKTLTK